MLGSRSGAKRCAVAIACLWGVATSGLLIDVRAQDAAERWNEPLSRAAKQLEAAVSRTIQPDSRLRRHADRVLQRASDLTARRETPADKDLAALRDSAIVFKSELLDAAPQVHPERLVRLEELLRLTDAIARQATSAAYAKAQSQDEVSAQIAASNLELADELLAAVGNLQKAANDGRNPRQARLLTRSRSLRDQVRALNSQELEDADQLAASAANLAMNLRAELLVLAFQDSAPPLSDLQPIRRGLLSLEGSLMDFASIAARRQGRDSANHLLRTAAALELTVSDLKALRDVASNRQRTMVETMLGETQRVGVDVQNLIYDSSYAPARRLDDIYGRFTHILQQADLYAPQAGEQATEALAIAQADLVALRELTILAATEHLEPIRSMANAPTPRLDARPRHATRATSRDENR